MADVVVVVGVADDRVMMMMLMIDVIRGGMLWAIRGKGDGGRGVVDVGGARVHRERRGLGTGCAAPAADVLQASWTDAPLGPR